MKCMKLGFDADVILDRKKSDCCLCGHRMVTYQMNNRSLFTNDICNPLLKTFIYVYFYVLTNIFSFGI